MNNQSPLLPHLEEYRKWLVSAEQKAQEDFDKTILSLSGGALGVSFIFLKDVIGANPINFPSLLFFSWLAWALSTFAVLASYYLSHLALRRAISQVDNGTIYEQRPGGSFTTCTAILNAVGAVLFLAGVCSITAFAHFNLSPKKATSAPTETTSTPNSTTWHGTSTIPFTFVGYCPPKPPKPQPDPPPLPEPPCPGE